MKEFFTKLFRFKKLSSMELDPMELQHVPCHPPRRRLFDILPAAFRNWFRERWEWPGQSPYEEWLVRSLYLRSYYLTHVVEPARNPGYFVHEAIDKPAKEDDDGKVWN
jgi:hypothetical protein